MSFFCRHHGFGGTLLVNNAIFVAVYLKEKRNFKSMYTYLYTLKFTSPELFNAMKSRNLKSVVKSPTNYRELIQEADRLMNSVSGDIRFLVRMYVERG